MDIGHSMVSIVLSIVHCTILRVLGWCLYIDIYIYMYSVEPLFFWLVQHTNFESSIYFYFINLSKIDAKTKRYIMGWFHGNVP